MAAVATVPGWSGRGQRGERGLIMASTGGCYCPSGLPPACSPRVIPQRSNLGVVVGFYIASRATPTGFELSPAR